MALTDTFSTISQVSVLGRVYAKLDEDYSTSLMGNFRRLKLFVVKLDLEGVKQETVALIRSMQHAPTTLESAKLEWGTIPDEWFLLDSEDIFPYITEDMSVQMKKDGLCPKCGDDGEWINLAVVCPFHGRFI